jgi:hypothetical protein
MAWDMGMGYGHIARGMGMGYGRMAWGMGMGYGRMAWGVQRDRRQTAALGVACPQGAQRQGMAGLDETLGRLWVYWSPPLGTFHVGL